MNATNHSAAGRILKIEVKRETDFYAEKTNGDRARQGAEAVKAANLARGEVPRIDEDGIRDLLADLGHLCDREGLPFCQLIAVARRDWRAER